MAGKWLTTVLATTALMVMAIGSANAGIVVTNSTGYADNNADNAEGVGFYDASGDDKLIVIVTGEHGFPNNTGGININGVTYGGVAMTPAVIRDGLPEVDNVSPDQEFNHMYYLDSPGTGDIVVDTNLSRMVVSIVGLTGTVDGVVGNTAVSGLATKSVDLTTTAANSFVIASNGLGGTGNNGNVDGLDANPPLTLLSAVETNGNYAGHLIGGTEVATPGLGTYSFTGSTSGSHVIAAEFLAIPEPGSLALLGIGGLMLLRRRKATA